MRCDQVLSFRLRHLFSDLAPLLCSGDNSVFWIGLGHMAVVSEKAEVNTDRGNESIDHVVDGNVQPSTCLSEADRVQKETQVARMRTEESAAVQVQRLYRGYRTRRTIADAEIMAHKFGWWNVVDGALLDYNSSQFYAYHRPQSASERWLRLKKKAARVGKGLSKNEKARKLALQHWLEAIDPRHRYGHNLHFYYEEWRKSQTQQPFFYWLDVGEGKEIELEKCKRAKLQQELIRYLSPKERKWYEVVIEDGKLVNKMTWEPVNTPKGEKWIFVMSTSGKLYVAKKEKGKLQHSSFLAGGATTAAGRLLVDHGSIQLMEAHSGHYHPTPQNFHQLIDILTRSGADLTLAQVQFVSDDQLTPSGSLKAGGVQEVDPVVAEDVLTQECSKEEDGCARELGSLSLEDEQNPSSVEKVTLVEGTASREARDNCDFSGLHANSNDKGMRLEIRKSSEMSTSSEDLLAGDEFAKSFVEDAPEEFIPNSLPRYALAEQTVLTSNKNL